MKKIIAFIISCSLLTSCASGVKPQNLEESFSYGLLDFNFAVKNEYNVLHISNTNIGYGTNLQEVKSKISFFIEQIKPDLTIFNGHLFKYACKNQVREFSNYLNKLNIRKCVTFSESDYEGQYSRRWFISEMLKPKAIDTPIEEAYYNNYNSNPLSFKYSINLYDPINHDNKYALLYVLNTKQFHFQDMECVDDRIDESFYQFIKTDSYSETIDDNLPNFIFVNDADELLKKEMEGKEKLIGDINEIQGIRTLSSLDLIENFGNCRTSAFLSSSKNNDDMIVKEQDMIFGFAKGDASLLTIKNDFTYCYSNLLFEDEKSLRKESTPFYPLEVKDVQ